MLRLFGRVEHDGMLHYAGCSEIIADTTDGDDQRVVGKGALWRELAPFIVEGGGEVDPAFGTIDVRHFAIAELEAMPVPLCQVVELVVIDIHAPCRDLI